MNDTSTPRAAPIPTFREFGEAWTSGELHARYPDQIPLKDTAKDDASRLRLYVYPRIGDKPIDQVTLDDCEKIMRNLPESAAGSRRHIAGPLRRLLQMAVYPCRYIERSPLPKGFLPRARPRDCASRWPSYSGSPRCFCMLCGHADSAPTWPLATAYHSRTHRR